MSLHQAIQRVLLVGARLDTAEAAPSVGPPGRLAPLVEAIAPEHRKFDQRAIHFGHRYRSGFWAIYLMSALAVLCGVMPLALGWNDPASAYHRFAIVWPIAVIVLIGAVSVIYSLGHRRGWQDEWLRARTTAELAGYLPMLAPLIDFDAPQSETNWYARILQPGQDLPTADEISTLCERVEAQARTALTGAWTDAAFVDEYLRWTVGTLEQQRRYHRRVAARQKALVGRVHGINGALFGLTALCALLHLIVHSHWLLLTTTFFPALAASLHGALAQSEAHRLAAASARLGRELADLIERIAIAWRAADSAERRSDLKRLIETSLVLILEEHRDWNLLVRPHRLPLA